MTRKKTLMVIAGGALAIIVAAALTGPLMSRVEQPNYLVVTSEGSVEIRKYDAMIVAETEVQGERKTAINQGFRLLAAYIFGANQPNTKIAMTAPVQQQPSQAIAMTAPVTQQSGDGNWVVRFTMPKAWTMETLPLPNDTRIRLVNVPPARFLALRYSGFASDETVKAKTAELRDHASRHGLKITDVPVIAFYDPPWTLPFLRRNEIMFEMREP